LHRSKFYHLCLFVSRYYVVVCAALWPLAPRLSVSALAMHTLAGIVQFRIRHPRLNPLSFLAFFSLEQTAYQLGVWWSCCRRRFYKPLLPRPVFSLTSLKLVNRKIGHQNQRQKPLAFDLRKESKTSGCRRIPGGIEFAAEAKGHEGSGSRRGKRLRGLFCFCSANRHDGKG
jgi:hypothetical protein